MIEKLVEIIQVMNQYWWIAAVSVIFIPVVIIIVPIVIISLPTDYFSAKKRHSIIQAYIFPFNIIVVVLKNFLGFIILIVGIIFIFTPGQGFLTITAGLMLMNFPGKRKLEIAVVKKKPVLNVINWIRKKGGREVLSDIYSG